MFRRVLVANRGVIACRIIRTLKRMGIGSVAVHSAVDRQSLHVLQADRAIAIGPPAANSSYLSAQAVLDAARESGADAIHPGYGFLSESAAFAAACEAAGLAFIGPRPEHLEVFAANHRARELAASLRIPTLPGTAVLPDLAAANEAAARLRYPLMLKSSNGGSGIGLQAVRSADELARAWPAIERALDTNLREPGLYLEKYVAHARHVEVQILGDGRGRVIALGERDGSVQRRHQKVVAECPAPELDAAVRQRMHDTAVRLGEAVRFRSAGTVEFLFDAMTGQFYFLECNPRLHVEHGVTEEVLKLDLVELMLRVAAGEPRVIERLRPRSSGVSIEVRLNAEDPGRDFQPGAGLLTDVRFPGNTRVDTWIERGSEVTAWYDPLLATLTVHGETRQNALAKLGAALQSTRLTGIETNLEWLRAVVAEPAFLAGLHTTRLLHNLLWRPPVVHVLESGVQSMVQDWPGRIGYWHVGVPPSGPMDEFAFRVANGLVGNERAGSSQTTAGIECTMTGPTLRFDCDAVIAVTGAPIELTLNGEALEMWTSHAITAGSVLKLGRIRGPGSRAYLAVAGGLDVPAYLGSRSTFMLGRFGGHAGRSLRNGDVLHLAQSALSATLLSGATPPEYAHHWSVGVLIGPQSAPDVLAPADIEQLFAATWTVHYNSSRAGLRLVGPKPQWARADGGEPGLHPSSVHDHPYSVGAITFVGDTPLIVGPDGPTLGGHVSAAVVAQAELWKLGQIRPGDTLQFRLIGTETAAELARLLERSIEAFEPPPSIDALLPSLPSTGATQSASFVAPSPILGGRLGDPIPSSDRRVAVAYRQSGDAGVLVEYGAPLLDLGLRVRVHALMEALRQGGLPGILDLTPGIRTLQIHFDPARLVRSRLLATLERLEDELPALDELEVPSRIVHLPLAWNDSLTRAAIATYATAVRTDAPWCPSNIEFVRRVNGLPSVDAVRDIVQAASYIVLGLGHVPLGAPVTTPVDPRHRLIAPRYNPMRKSTPENAVGIGGPYLCVGGMEGPGNLQLLGRTLQMWNRYRVTQEFEWNRPWLLRSFDQVRFFPVEEAELDGMREDFVAGRLRLRIEQATFSLRRHHAFLRAHAASILAFRQGQQAAFAAERERWRSGAHGVEASEEREHSTRGLRQIPDGARALTATVSGTVWRVFKRPGEVFAAGEVVIVLESMKMECQVHAPTAGRMIGLLVREGSPVVAGLDVLIFEPL